MNGTRQENDSGHRPVSLGQALLHPDRSQLLFFACASVVAIFFIYMYISGVRVGPARGLDYLSARGVLALMFPLCYLYSGIFRRDRSLGFGLAVLTFIAYWAASWTHYL